LFLHTGSSAGNPSPVALAVGDINRDGRLDVLCNSDGYAMRAAFTGSDGASKEAGRLAFHWTLTGRPPESSILELIGGDPYLSAGVSVPGGDVVVRGGGADGAQIRAGGGGG